MFSGISDELLQSCHFFNPYPHGRFLAPITHGLKVTFEGLSPAHFTPFPMLYNHYN